MSETLIKVEGVSKKFCRSLKKSLWYGLQDLGSEITGQPHGGGGELRVDEFWAVKDISFELKRGECLGLIGYNGAGKTTLLRMLNGLIKPDSGRIEMRGKIGALIALGAGFNPILTGRENIYVNASVLGVSKKEIDDKFDDIVDFSGVDEFIDSPVQTYSTGMQVRLGFSVATALDPDILIIDEVLAVGDSKFRAKCYNRIASMLSNTAVILVSHKMNDIARTCNRGLFIKSGMVAVAGETQAAIAAYNEESGLEQKEIHAGNQKVRFKSYFVKSISKESGENALEINLVLSSSEELKFVEVVVSIKNTESQIVLQCPAIITVSEGFSKLDITHEKIPLGGEQFHYRIEMRDFNTGEVYHLIENAGSFTVNAVKRYVASVVMKPTSIVLESTQETRK